jgi:hypothetical protein
MDKRPRIERADQVVIGIVGLHLDDRAGGLIEVVDSDDITAAGQCDRLRGRGVDPVADRREAGVYHMALSKLRADGDEGQKRGRRHVDGQHGGSGDSIAGIKRRELNAVGSGKAGGRRVEVRAVRKKVDLPATGGSVPSPDNRQRPIRARIVRQHSIGCIDFKRSLFGGADLDVVNHRCVSPVEGRSWTLGRREQRGVSLSYLHHTPAQGP